MKTQILECDIIVNKKKTNIINSEMFLELEWDIDIIKNNDSISINPILKNLKGYVSFTTQSNAYKKNTRLDFNTDSGWELKSKKPTIELDPYSSIQPVYSLIDFDEKKVMIEY